MYIGKPVILICNENFNCVQYATVHSVEVTGADNNIAMIVFKDNLTEELFTSGAICLPDTENMRKLVNYLGTICKDNKERWNMLADIKTYDKNMDYFCEFSYLDSK
jgi:hypothetical protein